MKPFLLIITLVFTYCLPSTAQTLSAIDMLNLTACSKPECFTQPLKELGFKAIVDTTKAPSGNQTYTYISKRSVAPKKQKNHVACIIGNNRSYCAVMFTTIVEQMQRRLLNSFITLGFSGGLKMIGADGQEHITYTSDYYPYTDLKFITNRDATGARITGYTFVLTRIRK